MVLGCSWYEYWYRGTTALAWDARVVPVDLAYVIFIDFLALGVLRFCFLLLSNVQFLVLVNLPPGRSHAGGISSRHSRRRYPYNHQWLPRLIHKVHYVAPTQIWDTPPRSRARGFECDTFVAGSSSSFEYRHASAWPIRYKGSTYWGSSS